MKKHYIDEKVWALAQWEIHVKRCLVDNIVETLKMCAETRPGPSDRFGASVRNVPPLGIHVAVEEVNRLVEEHDALFRDAWELEPDEINRRINEAGRSWSNLVDNFDIRKPRG